MKSVSTWRNIWPADFKLKRTKKYCLTRKHQKPLLFKSAEENKQALGYLFLSIEKRPAACKKSYVLGYVSNGSHLCRKHKQLLSEVHESSLFRPWMWSRTYQSCMTPRSPRSYITGNVFGPLMGTTFKTHESKLFSINADANLQKRKTLMSTI